MIGVVMYLPLPYSILFISETLLYYIAVCLLQNIYPMLLLMLFAQA